MMNHDNFAIRLDDYVDGELSGAERRLLEAHVAECETCHAELEAVRRLKAAVGALPRELQPQRDLWADIAARIEPRTAPEAGRQPSRVIEVDFRRPAVRPVWVRRGLQAAAAIVLVVVSSSVTLLLVRGSGGGPSFVEAPPQGAPATGSALVAFQPSEREFIDTVDQLSATLEAQRERLRPETVAVVEENLRIISQAIQEARGALEADPHNRELTLMLAGVYMKKIELLQDAVQLSSL